MGYLDMNIIRRMAAVLSVVALVGASPVFAQTAPAGGSEVSSTDSAPKIQSVTRKSGMTLLNAVAPVASTLSTLNTRKAAEVSVEVKAEGALVAPTTVEVDPRFPLPDGLTFDPATGTISGSVAQPGQTLVRFTLTNGNGKKADATLTVGIYNNLSVTPIEDLYVARYDAITTPIKVTIDPKGVIPNEKGSKLPKVDVIGDLPAGITYSSVLGGFTGGTTAPEGVYGPIALQVTDGSGTTVTSNEFSVHIMPRKTISVVAEDVTTDITRGLVEPITEVVRPPLSRTLPISFQLEAGTLPPELSVDAANGRIVGVPSVPGVYPGLKIRATDGEGFSGVSQAFKLTVNEAGPLSASPRDDVTVAVNTPARLEPSKFVFVVGNLQYLSAAGLPAGLEMASNGVITGTPTNLADKAVVTVSVKDSANRTATGKFKISVIGWPTLTFAEGAASPLQAAQYETKTWKLKPSNIIGTATFSMSKGSLPAGFALFQTGTISGKSETKGSFTGLKASVTDSATGLSADLPFSVVIGDRKVTELSYANPSTVFVNSLNGPIAPKVNNTKGTVSYQLVSGSLPTGMTFEPLNGLITGQPSATGRFRDITVKATDSEGVAAQTKFDIFSTRTGSVFGPADIFLRYRAGESFTTPAIPYDNVVLPLRYTLQTAAPGGTLFDQTTGKFSGQLSLAGTVSATVMVTDAHDRSPAAGTRVHIQSMAPVSIASQPSNVTVYQYGKNKASISAAFSNLIGNATYTLQGVLPTGLVFDPASGTITGQASQTGVFNNLRISAKDSHDNSTATTNTFSITVLARKPLSAQLPSSVTTLVERGMADFAATTVTNDAYGAGVTFSLSGTLPAGVTFDNVTGTFSGKPTALGTFSNIRVTATDTVGATATTAPMTIKVVLNGDPIGLVVQDIKTHVGWQFETPAPVVSNDIGKVNFYSYDLIPEISLDAKTGIMSGTFGQPYDFEFDLYVADQTARVTSDRLKVTALPDVRTVYPSTITAPQFQPMTEITPDVTYKVGTVSFAKGNPSAWPAGLLLDAATGRIYGKAEEYGQFSNLTVLATDTQGSNTMTVASNTFTLNVSEFAGKPVMQKSVSNWEVAGLKFFVGTPASFTPTVTDTILGQPWTYPGTVYSINKTLPGGLTFDATTGRISGTPTGASSVDGVVITVTSKNGFASSTNPFWLGVQPTGDLTVVAEPSSVTTRPGKPVTIPAPVVTNTVGKLNFVKVQGDSQNYITLDPLTGEITVTLPANHPTGNFWNYFAIYDQFGRYAGFNHILSVLAPPTVSYGNKTFLINENDSLAPVTTGVQSGSVFTISPALPAGLTLNASTGVISGKPTAALGPTSFTVTLTDSFGTVSSGAFNLSVATEPPPVAHRAFTLYFSGTNSTGGSGARIGDIAAIGQSGSEIAPSRTYMYDFGYSTSAIRDGSHTTSLYSGTFGGGVVMEFDGTAAVSKLRLKMTGNADPRFVRICTSENYGWALGGYFSYGNPYSSCTAEFALANSSINGGAVYAAGELVDVRVSGSSVSLGLNGPPSIAYQSSYAGSLATPVSFGPSSSAYIVPGSTFSVSPALPAGLTLNTSTGLISGTPTQVAAAQDYTVTVTNQNGSSSSTFNFVVTAQPTGYTNWRWTCSTATNGKPDISEMVLYQDGVNVNGSIKSVITPNPYSTNYDAAKMIDGDPNTFMSVGSSGVPADWVVNITLNNPKLINSFSMRPRPSFAGGYSCTNWTMAYSADGVTYTPSWSETFNGWSSDSMVKLSTKP